MPLGIKDDATFIIDTSKLKSPDDIRADDLGVWVNNGVRRVWLTCNVSAQSVSGIEILGRKPSTLPSKHYQLVRSYFFHKGSRDFRKVIVQLFGKHDILLMMYKVHAQTPQQDTIFGQLHTMCEAYAYYRKGVAQLVTIFSPNTAQFEF